MVQDRGIATMDDYWENTVRITCRVIVARRRAIDTLKATRLPQQFDIDTI